jgi:hypothetical protein
MFSGRKLLLWTCHGEINQQYGKFEKGELLAKYKIKTDSKNSVIANEVWQSRESGEYSWNSNNFNPIFQAFNQLQPTPNQQKLPIPTHLVTLVMSTQLQTFWSVQLPSPQIQS